MLKYALAALVIDIVGMLFFKFMGDCAKETKIEKFASFFVTVVGVLVILFLPIVGWVALAAIFS